MSRALLSCFIFLAATGAIAFDRDAINASCDEQWGTDFKMVKYCRNQQVSAAQKYDLEVRAAKQGLVEAEILANCASDWGTDYKMAMYCNKQQKAAFQSLGNSDPGLPENIEKTVKSDCQAQWGTDFKMIAYCVKTQSSAWKELK